MDKKLNLDEAQETLAKCYVAMSEVDYELRLWRYEKERSLMQVSIYVLGHVMRKAFRPYRNLFRRLS